MGKQYKTLTESHRTFITKQKVFFFASCSGAEVNLSPKGYDSLRVLDESHLLYLDYPGSGNRTARDIAAGGNVTIMFTAFDGPPMILRLFCKGELLEKTDPHFEKMVREFEGIDAAAIRRLIRFTITAVERSCGEATPIMTFQKERTTLREWAKKHAAKGTLDAYVRNHAEPPTL